jgi:hypothetical protein
MNALHKLRIKNRTNSSTSHDMKITQLQFKTEDVIASSERTGSLGSHATRNLTHSKIFFKFILPHFRQI